MNGGLYPLLDRLGLSLGGATYKEFVQFSISGAQAHWQEAVELFCRLFDPILSLIHILQIWKIVQEIPPLPCP